LSCNRNGERVANNASGQNGVWGQVSRYLNTVGSWRTYRDLKSLDQVPERLEQVTSAFFGLNGLVEGMPRISGILGVIVGIHALEQVTGAVATSGMRLLVRGRPMAKYRGMIIRKSPLTPKKAKVLNRVTGGRLLAADGYYFHEGGRTWHCQSFTVNVRGTPRTLTHIRSLSLPPREHFFDRPLILNKGAGETQIGDDATARSVSVQRVINTVMGDEDPGNIPGYIGSTNELENASGLGGIKRTFFAANWFLVDESERDLPSDPNFVDYDALVQGRPPGRQDRGYYQVTRPGGSGGGTGYARPGWPSTTSQSVPVRSASSSAQPIPGLNSKAKTTSAPDHYGANLFRSKPKQPPPGTDPYVAVKDRYHHSNGKYYPLVVRRVVTHPISHTKKADAIYYDGEAGTWREIIDDDVREALAREVEAGKLQVSENWQP